MLYTSRQSHIRMRSVSTNVLMYAEAPTCDSVSFTQTTGICFILKPRRFANDNISTSKPQPAIFWSGKTFSAESLVKHLNPHCVSQMPGKTSDSAEKVF